MSYYVLPRSAPHAPPQSMPCPAPPRPSANRPAPSCPVGRFDCFVVLWLFFYSVLVCLTCVNNTDFCYFDAFYFLKLSEEAMVFMYPCMCMLVFAYYVILQMSSSICTHIYLSRRSTRDEWAPQCSYSLPVGPRGEVRVVFLMVNGSVTRTSAVQG